MSKHNHRYERRTSWEVVITYLFVVALCAALFYYIFNLRKTIDNQRSNISTQHATLDWVNRFTKNVHEAQNAANLYAFTEQPSYKKQFNAARDKITAQADSLMAIEMNEDNKLMVNEISGLIKSKGRLSNELSRQFHDFNPLAEFDRTIEDYVPPKPEEEIVVTKVSKDTIIHVPKTPTKKGFWGRVGNVFKPEEVEEDSIVHLTIEKTDTLHIQQHRPDSLTILADLRVLSERAKTEYWNKIKEYENKTQQLVRADNRLSEQISSLLIRLNQEILDSTIAEIEKSEALIKENTQTSLLIGAVTLLLIIIFIILIISDVNKGYRARRAAEEAKKKTEEIMESRHKLLLTVSHDIKAPLSSIMGHVELMDKTDNEKEISSIQQSADHILNLLNNLLEYSSLEQGKLQVSKENFDIGQLCEEIGEMFAPIAQHKNLQFSLENSIEANTILNSDKLKIRQILTNLISNGIKYTLEGSVTFKARLGRNLVVFDVIDTGMGIPEDQREEVFKPFARIESYNQFAEGSGYGMTVVKGLIDLLGGEISIESEVGKGTHFEVRLPVEVVKVEDGSDQRNAKSLNILVFDDDNTFLSVISNMLHRLGHQAIPCRSMNDFDSALQQIEEYDYILTDREMGAMTGNDILYLVKEVDNKKPIILMTGRIEYTTEKAKEEGFDGFLQKPFNMKQLENMFGNVAAKGEGETTTCPFSEDFPTFSQVMGDDEEAIRQVLTVFVQSTADDLVLMNTLIEESKFVDTQDLCHKILPMFTQLERDTTFLAKMNTLRGQGKKEKHYRHWKDDARKFMAQTDELMDLLAEKYGIE